MFLKKFKRFFDLRFRLVIWRSKRRENKVCEDKIAFLSRTYGDKELPSTYRKIYIQNIHNFRKEAYVNCGCLNSIKWGYLHGC